MNLWKGTISGNCCKGYCIFVMHLSASKLPPTPDRQFLICSHTSWRWKQNDNHWHPVTDAWWARNKQGSPLSLVRFCFVLVFRFSGCQWFSYLRPDAPLFIPLPQNKIGHLEPPADEGQKLTPETWRRSFFFSFFWFLMGRSIFLFWSTTTMIHRNSNEKHQ